jgi:SAM-dependent methyltransferase
VKCRHCDSHDLMPFLDLGSAPPSNAYLTSATLHAAETWLPLRLLACRSCWLVQTEDYAGREALFTEDYAYFSSFSSSWLAHAQRYVMMMIERLALGPHSLIVEIAANDGYLLRHAKAAGVPCLGVEPTTAAATAARSLGLEMIERFFGTALGRELAARTGGADLMVANNVLAHVPDINDFVAGFTTLLKPSGVATFEFPHLLRMVAENQFDTAYHEHYSYLSLAAVKRIMERAGLTVFDVEILPTHGGSLRVFVQPTATGCHPLNKRVATVLEDERRAGLEGEAFYQSFQARAEKAKDDLLAFLIEVKRQGARIAAYGAAAKGNTLLNFAGVRPDLLPYVVDKNPAKQGKFMPGSRIPIVAPDRLWAERPDYILIAPWNLRTEVTEQLLDDFTRSGAPWQGRFVTAIPALTIGPQGAAIADSMQDRPS